VSGACLRLGFTVAVRPAPALDDEARVALRRALRDAVEARGLESTPVGEWMVLVTGVGTQATDADREALAAWAAERLDVAAHAVGALVDLLG